MENNYCVYFYLREDKTPYYVGMGRKQRPFAKHAHRQDKGDFKPKNHHLINIIHENLSQQEAYDLEIKYIKEFGRKCDGGILINLTEGGEGAKHNEETRRKISMIQVGRKASDETKRKMSQAHKGRKKSPESIAKAVETRKANGSYLPSEQTRKKMSVIGKKNAKYGSDNPAARKVIVFDLKSNFIGQFDTAREAAKKLNINSSHISSVCKGKRKHTFGYVFKYADKLGSDNVV